MVSWLLLPHLPDGDVLLNVFYPNPNPETAFFQKKTKPNPNHTFYWHPFEFVHFLMHTHPALSFPSPPCFWAFCSLMHLKMFIIFCFIYHDGRCNKYLPFQLCLSWKVLSPWRGDIPFFICTQPFLPPSLRVSFWKVGLRCNLDPSNISFKIKVMHQVLTKN